MDKTQKAIREIRHVDELAMGDSFIHRLSPLTKVLITVFYIIIVVSFDKYDLTGLSIMVLYPAVLYQLSGISVKTCFYKMRVVMPLVCAVGLFNPFFDTALIDMGGMEVRAGLISMLTLMLKGVYCLLQSFLLVATTPIDQICRALRRIHFPKILTSLILLTYRYVAVLLEEVSIMSEAYHLRAPGQKGIHHKAWGSFLGQLLLRSIDRAHEVYESMVLRGFNGDFRHMESAKGSEYSWVFCLLSFILISCFRYFNIAEQIGYMVTGY